MGADTLGRVCPDAVIATPILSDPPHPGKGPSMSANITPEAAKSLDPNESRRQRGLAIAEVTRITEKDGQWIVPSQTGNGYHRVILDPPPFVPMCTCKDFAARERPCKHVYAVRSFLEREANPTGKEPITLPATENAPEARAIAKKLVAPRPTYKQAWPAYNAAQINEKAKFQTLPSDLCRSIPEPPRNPKGGRPPLPMADRAFACAFKVYTTFSGRRSSTDIRDARDKGHLSRTPHYSAVYRYLEDPAMTPILMGLISESARPLRSIEVDFVVDSSGFATSRFVRWFDHKYGVVKREYDWVKVSVMTGVKTNVVTAAEIDERYAADSPQFASLVNATAQAFTLREVSADAAYLGYENMELVASHGGIPYIAFKSNSTAGDGGMMRRMFHLYNFNRDEYLAHYHKRSNVESTFSMIKAKFGDSLRSKTGTAMVNEALCKVLCHNICCLIQSMFEIGIEARFWNVEEVPEARTEMAVEIAPVEVFAWI
jgi:transposase